MAKIRVNVCVRVTISISVRIKLRGMVKRRRLRIRVRVRFRGEVGEVWSCLRTLLGAGFQTAMEIAHCHLDSVFTAYIG